MDICKIKSPPWKRLSAVLFITVLHISRTILDCVLKKYLTKESLYPTHQSGMTVLMIQSAICHLVTIRYSIIYFLFSWTGSISLTICRTTWFLHRKKGKSSSHPSNLISRKWVYTENNHCCGKVLICTLYSADRHFLKVCFTGNIN